MVRSSSHLLKYLIETLQHLEQRGIDSRSLTENIGTTTPGGKLIFHIFGSLAEFERALIAERTQVGLAAACACGHNGAVQREAPVMTRKSLL